MADDPNRDVLPIKEGSYVDTCHSNITDRRERHAVCKLDRYQLEDRYLRLLEEAHGLKKLSNSQEDKIKRLATKLMRVSSNPRGCITALGINNDKDRIASLELENTKLKDKVCVLRNQLLSHKIFGRSTSRSRHLQSGTLSGPTTCRSETGRAKTPCYQCTARNEIADNDTQNYLVKIEELETQKKEMISRITELESELANYMAGSQREKIAENVEYIRIWRQMKQNTDKLIATQTVNETLKAQVHDLKKLLEETTRNNREITAALVAERKRMAEMDEQMTKAKDSQLSLREKDEQIRDLMNEMKILQQHNNELITLSSKYGQAEVENVELKKKISKQLSDHQSLKSAFNNEQANIVALQAANEQLLGKLQELQKNMDSLTIQLMSFQNQNEKYNRITTAVQASVKHIDKKTSVSSLIEESLEPSEDLSSGQVDSCKRCCCATLHEKSVTLEKVVPSSHNYVDKEVQTMTEIKRKTNSIEMLCNMKEQNKSNESSSYTKCCSKDELQAKGESREFQNEIPLSREKMLKLLEQAQINTPLEAQNAARIRQIDATCDLNCSGMSESNQGQSRTQEILWHEHFTQSGKSADISEHRNVPPETIKPHNPKLHDPNEILLILYDILQEYSNKRSKCCDVDNAFSHKELRSVNCEQSSPIIDYCDNTINHKHCDINNNSTNINYKECDTSRPCSTLYEMLKEKSRPKLKTLDDDRTVMPNQQNKFTETENCTCKRDQGCYVNVNCDLKCCTTSCSTQNLISHSEKYSKCNCKTSSVPIDKEMRNVDSTIQKAFDSVHTVHVMLQKNGINYVGNSECNNLWRKVKSSKNPKDLLPLDQRVKITSCELDKRRELLRSQYNINCLYKKHRNVTTRKVDCLNDSQITSVCDASSIPKLTTKEQGLVEIHILCLQFSAFAAQIFFEKYDMCNLSFFISWDIWGQETAFTPSLNYPRLNFNSSFVYRIPKLFEFFDCISHEHVIFQIHVMHQDESIYTVAQAKLGIKDILDYPQNKLHYVTPVFSIIPCSYGTNFGQLSLWIRLSCDLNVVESFKNRKDLLSQLEQTQCIRLQEKRPEKKVLANNVVQPVQLQECRKYKNFNKENDNTKTNGSVSSIIAITNNEVEKTDNGSDTTHKNDNTFSLLPVTSKDCNSGVNQHCKRDSGEQIETLSIAEFNKVLENPIEKDVIIIEIISMTLFQRTTFIDDPEVHLLYVEFSFLGYRGADMETISLSKPEIQNEPMIYNFKKKFEIDEKTHSVQRNLLRAMLSSNANQNIRFTIVSEPLPEEMNIKECIEVGYADFNLRKYALGNSVKEVHLVIMNPEQTEKIGILKITVLGIEAIRECMTIQN